MSDAEFTPGPWVADGSLVLAENRSLIGAFAPRARPQEQERANAVLAAAAPDLLDALKITLHHLALFCRATDADYEATRARAQAAIARATGDAS